MTQAQEDAVAEVKKILGEQFDAYLLVVKAEYDDTGDQHPTFWDGGFANALGLAHIAIDDLRKTRKPEEAE